MHPHRDSSAHWRPGDFGRSGRLRTRGRARASRARHPARPRTPAIRWCRSGWLTTRGAAYMWRTPRCRRRTHSFWGAGNTAMRLGCSSVAQPNGHGARRKQPMIPRVCVDAEGAPTMILPKVRDPRFVTIRRGGTLTDSDHQLLALWAAACAEHVLDLFESAQPEDTRPRQAIEQARAWVRGEITMTLARMAAGHANAAARDLSGAARHAAYAD